MTRLQRSYQRGFVSGPIRTRRGTAFKIRYRVRTAAGQWRQKSETLYDVSGKKAARDVLASRLKDFTALKIETNDLTLAGYVSSYWSPYLDRRGMKASTRESYTSALNRHILPAFGEYRITDITPLHIEEFSQAKTKDGLSAKSVRNLVLVIQGIFSLAVDNDVVVKSPVRKSHKPVYHRREKPTWSPAQVLSIMQAAPAGYRAFFRCAGLTGARLGELLALQNRHIDLVSRKLRIEQSLWHGEVVPPKTPGSVRTIYFGNALYDALEQHLQRIGHKNPNDFVFCKTDGTPFHPDVLRKDVLYPTLDKLGIPRVSGSSGFHTFRHSAASILNAQTGNLKLAQTLLGHAAIDVTANIYTHVSPEKEREAALAIERAIYGDLFPVVPNSGNRNNSAAIN
jgi:integrase